MPATDILEPQNLVALYDRFANEDTPLGEWFPERNSTESGQQIAWDIVEYARDIASIGTRDGDPKEVAPA